MRIGELAKALGVTPKTLRHYEKIGLVPEAGRSANGYRAYSEAAVDRAQLAVALRRLDLPLPDVRRLLDGADDGRSLRQRLMGLLDLQIQDHDLRIAVLQGRRDDLRARYDAMLSMPGRASGSCICGALLRPCTCGKP
ncbi:MAG: MerR family transcriptional regulator [Rhodobacteraceae bacterium]|nr:MerR family transcriptional regulator [Paracoccaceae bacterium]